MTKDAKNYNYFCCQGKLRRVLLAQFLFIKFYSFILVVTVPKLLITFIYIYIYILLDFETYVECEVHPQ